uniref:Tetratricopeptide repeat protein n=1 Tax=Panagrolaimus davidi TaxID=227884 RepID=A0A914PCV1_9BILA
MLGYEKKQDPNIGRAAQYFKVVAESKDEESRSLFSTETTSKSDILDTITGRLAMASYYFIIKDYHQAVIYYNSVIQFNKDDDKFNFNYGQANLFAENYEEAADALSKVKDQRYTSYSTYQQSLVRAYIRSGQSARAWAFYNQNQSNPHSMSVLKIIANDCYKLEDYLYSAMAFDILSKKDPRNNIYSVPKQGACLGILKLFTTQRADKEQLMTAFHILEQDRHSDALLLKARKWANEATLLG